MKEKMKKIFAFISLLLFYFINVFGEIPKNVIINNSKRIEYEAIDNEKIKLIIQNPKVLITVGICGILLIFISSIYFIITSNQ